MIIIIFRMYNEQQLGCQGIIDICIYLQSIRNMSSQWTKPIMFKISCTNNTNHNSFPFQIINQKLINQNTTSKSSIKVDTYNSKQFIVPPNRNNIIDEICIFRMHLPVSDFDLAYLNVKFQLLFEENYLGFLQLKFENILSLHTFMPVFFLPLSVSIDATIQTQLLGFRIPKAGHHPRSILYKIIDCMVIECNRLKEKQRILIEKKRQKEKQLQNIEELEQEEREQNNLITQFPEYHELKHQQQAHIFNKKSYEETHKNLMNFILNFIPEIAVKIKLKWNVYTQHLMEIQKLNLQNHKNRFFQDFSYEIMSKVVKSKFNDSLSVMSHKISVAGLQMYPIAQEQRHNSSASLQQGQDHHIVVLVHGYGANSFAMLGYQKTLSYLYPNLLILNSKSNSNDSQKTIEEMGRSLANQVHLYVQNKRLVNSQDFELSFISHSLGGLIVRAALQHLQTYRYCMKTFISLSTPHLGHLYHNSKLAKVGMWAMTTLSESIVMKTLLLNDSTQKRQSYLYNLSFHSGLSWFRSVIMYGCEDDGYVSPQSAVVDLNGKIMNSESENSKLWIQMLKNIQNNCLEGRMEKYIVKFKKQQINYFEEKLLGRNSHLAFVSDPMFINCVLLMNRKYFTLNP